MRRFTRVCLGLVSIVLVTLSAGLALGVNAAPNFPSGKQILLVEDPGCGSWGSSALKLLGISSFTAVSPAQFATVDLNLYNVLYIGNLPLDNGSCQNLVAALVGRSADIAAWAASTIVTCQDASVHFTTLAGGATAAGKLLANMLVFAAGSGHGIVAEVESFISVAPFGQTPYAWLPTPLTSKSIFEGASGDSVHIVTPTNVTQGLTDADLSNWSISFHCQYNGGMYTTLVEGTSTQFGTLPITMSTTRLHLLPPFVGRVCIVPGESTGCPQNLPFITGPPGGNLNVSTNIQGSTTFNAFNISMRWDPTVVNATGVDLTGTILRTPATIANCINGGGSGCGPLDGPGVAHVSVTGANTTSPATGRLFKTVFRVGLSGAEIRIGYQAGCSTSSVPNTRVCVLIATGPTTNPGILSVPEDIQSQLLGVQLPTPQAPLGLISGNFTGGGAPNFAETYVTPYTVTLPGNITTWKAQFLGGVLSSGIGVPASVQITVLRKASPTTLTVVAAGRVHDPRSILQQRIPGYPFFLTESSVMEFYSDPGIAVLPGDQIGLTIMSNSSIGGYFYPFVNRTDTRIFPGNVTVGGTIDLSACIPNPFPPPSCLPLPRLPFSPAIQVFIRVPPPANDTAGDGIPDFVKLSPEMRSLGADPCRKTIAVQLDYMVRPNQTAIDTVVGSFDSAPVLATLPCPYPGFPLKLSGIKLIVDVRNPVPFQSFLNFTHSGPQSFDSVKAAFLDPSRARYFHYGIFAHDLAPQGTPQSTISGVGEIFGSNFMVTLGEWPNGGSTSEQAGTLMHEIGHNLGLDHGGNTKDNFKPNYLSVMNYAFQVVGITSQTPSGNVTRFDYSSQSLPFLNESALDERVGVSTSSEITRWYCPDGRHVNFGLVSGPMDWNCNGLADNVKVSVDINNSTKLETLTGYNDWAGLRYKFTESESFGVGCRTGCDIGCRTGCDIGTELTYPQAALIESQWTAFLASPHRSTSVNLDCKPISVPVGDVSSCTATITDKSPGNVVTPTGNVSFTSTRTGSFSPRDTCTLKGAGASASCSVNYTPSATSLGTQTISAAFVGDNNHMGSSGSTTITGLPPVITLTRSTTLTTDIGKRIIIGTDNITLNCNGHTVNGIDTGGTSFPSNLGISLTGRRGVIIENCRVTNFYVGIQLVSSTRNLLLANNASSNAYGFLLSSSSFNGLLADTASNNLNDGFRLVSSNSTGLVANRANKNQGNGFTLINSSNDLLALNVANGNSGSGIWLSSSSRNILTSNSANNNKVYGFALLSSNSNRVSNNSACMNKIVDAFQDTTSAGNVYTNNRFCTSQGLPPPTD